MDFASTASNVGSPAPPSCNATERSFESIPSPNSARGQKTHTNPFLRHLLKATTTMQHHERVRNVDIPHPELVRSTLPPNTNGTLQNPSAQPPNPTLTTHLEEPNRRVVFVQRYNARNDGNSAKLRGADESNAPSRSSDFKTAPPQVLVRHDSYSRAVLQSGQSATSKSQAHHLPRTRRIDPGDDALTSHDCTQRGIAGVRGKLRRSVIVEARSGRGERTDVIVGLRNGVPASLSPTRAVFARHFCDVVKASDRNFEDNTHLGHAKSARGRCGEFLQRYDARNHGSAPRLRGGKSKVLHYNHNLPTHNSAPHQSPLRNKQRTPTFVSHRRTRPSQERGSAPAKAKFYLVHNPE
ncbi:hypothetical protein C8R43DRAFT_267795 [Mycena crocata]|nr:hypothetical protein C8R43DRAFT_267795 [Mycena crocata]